MVDDLMVPANCGKEGVVEWRPRSISHEVSVGSTSKPRTKGVEMGCGKRQDKNPSDKTERKPNMLRTHFLKHFTTVQPHHQTVQVQSSNAV